MTDSLSNGGAERQLSLLARSLPDSWKARVASLGDGVYAGILREAGIDVDVLPRAYRLDVSPAARLARVVRTWAPDIVHTWGGMSTAAAVAASAFQGIPLVDGSIRMGRVPPRGSGLQRAMLARADVVIANSQAGLDAYQIDAARGRVVYNGFDPQRWGLCASTDPVANRFTVVMTGRMHRDKDYACLLAAARILDADEPGTWSFLAVGSGSDRERLVRESVDVVRTGALSFPYAGTEVLPLVRGAQVGVLLTDTTVHAEGLSNSIIEYMACGLPVICTDTGGNRELVLHGRTGLVVPAGNPGAVASALRLLRDDPGFARTLGSAGRERVRGEFSVESLVSGTIAAYETALERRRSRRALRPAL